MKASAKMGLLLALGAVMTAGCSSSSSPGSSNGGSTGNGGSTSTGGSATGGSATGGAATGGAPATGGSAGAATGGSAGAETGGNGGKPGTGGNGGATGGSSSGGQTGTGGAGGGATSCDYGLPSGVGGATGATTAVILVDDVVLKDTTNAIVKQWQFADGTTIVDSTTDSGDKWTRTAYAPLNDNTGASDTFLGCDGNPANGSLKNVVPFASETTVANRYYEVHVPFAAADYHGHHITGKVKLVAGKGSCAPRAQLFSVLGKAPYTPANGTLVDLVEGQWVDVALDIPTAFDATDQIGLRLTWQGC